jgi:2-enoate reductase
VKNKKVVVAGGGLIGTEVGEYLVERGNKVTLVEMLPTIAADMEPLNRQGLLEALEGKDIVMLTRKEIQEITEKGVVVKDKKAGAKEVIEGDVVVVALGSKSFNPLEEKLKGNVAELYTVGDCSEPRRVEQAIYEGSLIARRI